jgi:hypothetical protein
MVYFDRDQQQDLSLDEVRKARADALEIHRNEVEALRLAHSRAIERFDRSPSPELRAYLRRMRFALCRTIREWEPGADR